VPRFLSSTAYSGRGIPPPTPTRMPRWGPRPRCVASSSNIPDILGRLALRSGRRAPDYCCRNLESKHLAAGTGGTSVPSSVASEMVLAYYGARDLQLIVAELVMSDSSKLHTPRHLRCVDHGDSHDLDSGLTYRPRAARAARRRLASIHHARSLVGGCQAGLAMKETEHVQDRVLQQSACRVRRNNET